MELEGHQAEQRVDDENLELQFSNGIGLSFVGVPVDDDVGYDVAQIVYVVAAGGFCSHIQPLPQKAEAQLLSQQPECKCQ